MADKDPDQPAEEADAEAPSSGFRANWVADQTDRFVQMVELAAAAVFAILFAIGVVDLGIQIVDSVQAGTITDPLVVIGFIDTGLLLLIIVEVYETVVAYTRAEGTRQIVRLVIYTGVIAMVRKAIIFRVGEYGTPQDALFAALAYTVIILGLVALLFAERIYGSDEGEIAL
ncbi:MAG: phosphate-starvation-inducible PsiE family protein [Halobacteriales archaeon]